MLVGFAWSSIVQDCPAVLPLGSGLWEYATIDHSVALFTSKRNKEKILSESEAAIKKLQQQQEDEKEAFKVATEQSNGDPVEKLKELGQLKKEGLISDEEFEAMKKKIIDG